MKKTTLVLTLALIAFVGSAQTIIPKFGVSIATSSFSPEDYGEGSDKKSSTGITFGVGYEYIVSDRISIMPEISYLQKGFQYTVNYSGDGYEFHDQLDVKLNYLEVPVLVKVKFGGNTKFFVTAGPSVAVGLGGKYTFESFFESTSVYKYKGDIEFGDEPTDYEGDNLFVNNRIDAGLQLGAGATLFGKVSIEARYGLGLTDIMDGFDSKNRTVQFTVGVPLNLF